ncbi:hypothetical protein GDO86_003431 [Hymenochirus boettgeri]|uniref:Small integral membrane protein 12 n=1 Tax=Hymenochirus boettgeri TaxID=247094 RepID=A0A8T2K0W3_9PIPI|nr:hypothetical protein GDO86_003431 [Hymenochirus boettgeri]
MWPILWAAARTYAPYITFPVAFVVGAVGYQLEWFIRGNPQPPVRISILEKKRRKTLQETAGRDLTQVISLKEN